MTEVEFLSRRQKIVEVASTDMNPYRNFLDGDRPASVFPPLPSKGTVKIEIVDRENWVPSYPPPLYDVMLHYIEIAGKGDYHYTNRTVALRREGERYKWIGEQMSFNGPRTYTRHPGDDPSREMLIITNETEQIAYVGEQLEGTRVIYSGPGVGDVSDRADIEIDAAKSIVALWGYANYGAESGPGG